MNTLHIVECLSESKYAQKPSWFELLILEMGLMTNVIMNRLNVNMNRLERQATLYEKLMFTYV